MSQPAADTDPHLAAALARAEHRLAMLEELAEIGMNLARSVGAHAAAAMAAINEDNGGDPTRAFATVSRSVRLTLAMQARVDAQILALRNGRVPAGWGAAAAVMRSAGPKTRAGEGPGALRESLVDWEDDEAFLDLPFEAGVEAIRRDLGQADQALAGEGAGGPAQVPGAESRPAKLRLGRNKLVAHATAGPPAPPPARSALAEGAGAYPRE